eukprot:2343212-Alexandrium_andersonii.AAC.1
MSGLVHRAIQHSALDAGTPLGFSQWDCLRAVVARSSARCVCCVECDTQHARCCECVPVALFSQGHRHYFQPRGCLE